MDDAPDGDWPLRARDAELEVLVEVLRRGLRDPSSPAGAVVSGPVGVGKTRLVREVGERARAEGVPVLHTIGTWTARQYPYGAVAHLAQSIASDEYPDPISLYREVSRSLPRHPRALLIVDDADQLDDASAALVLHLALTAAVTVLVTTRRGTVPPDSIVALWKDRLTIRLDLMPLSDSEMRTLIADVLGSSVASASLHRLAETAAGNVLYARELVRSTIQTGTLRRADGLWTWDGTVVLGERLVDIVGQRLAHLDDDDRASLARVALGQPLSLALAERVIGSAGLSRLESQSLICVADEQCRMQHPLFGEVLLSDLGAFAVRQALRELADGADELGAHDDEAIMRRLIWRIESGGRPRPGEAMRAARVALARFDPRNAERLAEAAGSGLEARLILALALNAQNRFAEAHAHLRAIEPSILSDFAGDDGLPSEWLDASLVALHQGMGRVGSSVSLLERFESAAAGRPSLRRLARAMRGNVLVEDGRLGETVAVCRAVIDDAEALDHATVIAAGALGEALANLGQTRSARDLHGMMRSLAGTSAEQVQRAAHFAVLQEAMCLVYEGWPHRAAAVVEPLYDALVAGRDHATIGLAAMELGIVRLMQGRVDDARHRLLEAIGQFRARDIDGALGWAFSLLAQAEALRGDVAAARSALDASLAGHRDVASARSRMDLTMARVRIGVATGDLTGAARAAREAVDPDSGYGAAEFVVHRSRLLLVMARHGAGSPHALAERSSALVAGAESELLALQADHIRALADRDGVAMEAVCAALEERGMGLDALLAAGDAARLLVEAGASSGARRMRAAAERIAAASGASHALPVDTGAEAPVALSRRERETARLAAEGLSNAEIAERLVLSVRTVESHLHQAFGKLGVRRRGDLALVLRPRQP